MQGSHISFDCRSGLWEDCAEEYKSAYYNIQGCTFQGTICDVQLDAVQIACICANVQTLQCAIKVQQQRAQLKILFEGSFATFPPPTSALVEKIQQPGT